MLLRGALRGTAAGEAAGPLPAEVRNVLSGLGLTGAQPAGGGASRQRWESLAAVAQLADDLRATRPGATLADFVAELQQRADLGHAPAMDGVTLASMHAAKGLEWDAVVLPGLVEGVMPIVYARTDAAIEEERRLLYVAVTRARERLFLSWASARGPGGRPSSQPSRYLPVLGYAAEPVPRRGPGQDHGW
jgi:DNA helicase-2/ATP-dependent DNA helicase PcrA